MNENYNRRAAKKPLYFSASLLDEQSEVVDEAQVVELFVLIVIFLAVLFFNPSGLPW